MEKLVAWMKTCRQNLFVMMLVVGGYLVYLAYDIVSNAGSTEGRIWPLYLAAVLFALCGAFIFGMSLLALVKGYYVEKNSTEEAPADEEDDADDETETEEFIDRY